MLIVGLGNPGAAYAGTRHNVGFELVDRLAVRWRAERETGGASTRARWASRSGRRVVLAKPVTYMNRSGLAVAALLGRLGLEPSGCLIVVDDMALDVGSVRFRRRGSSGGHNGLASIEEHLETQEFPRLRIGVGPAPPASEWVDFVLTAFDEEERERLDGALDRAVEGVETVLDEGMDAAMSRFNG